MLGELTARVTPNAGLRVEGCSIVRNNHEDSLLLGIFGVHDPLSGVGPLLAQLANGTPPDAHPEHMVVQSCGHSVPVGVRVRIAFFGLGQQLRSVLGRLSSVASHNRSQRILATSVTTLSNRTG